MMSFHLDYQRDATTQSRCIGSFTGKTLKDLLMRVELLANLREVCCHLKIMMKVN